MVSQPLDSSPMAGKSPQPSHGPPFQAPVTLKQDETVEGDIEEGVGVLERFKLIHYSLDTLCYI